MKRLVQILEIALISVIVVLAVMAAVLMIRFSPLWSQEAAGWVQAIGSIAAIAGAAWIASDQWRKTRDNEKLGALRYASMHCDSLSWTFEELLALIEQEKATMHGEHARLRLMKIVLKRFQGIGQELAGIPIGSLGHEDAATFVHLLKLCRTMELAFTFFLEDPIPVEIEHIVSILNERKPIAEGWATFLRQSYESARRLE